MDLDRDLAVAVVRAHFPPAPPTRRGWETNAATGVRGLRLLGEAERFGAFRLSEANDRSFSVLARNSSERPGATAVQEDARRPTFAEGTRFDYVDVDPYGSPLPFLDAAFASLEPGGLLAVTATDMMVLAGAQPSATRRLYGAEPVRGRLGPEAGLRILLGRLARTARRNGQSVRPLLGYVGEHHVRAFVVVGPATHRADPVETIDRAAFDGPSLGTGAPVGPLWVGPLGDPALLSRIDVPATAAAPRELSRLLELLRGEAAVHRPFFYEANTLASALGLERPAALSRLREALSELGFPSARTHVRPEGLKTDAPRSVVERLARELAGDAQSQNARVRA